MDARSVFPTDLLLDHVPALIEAIGKYVADPASEDVAANTIVIDKARDLGHLRHQQQASLHQVLREYDLLGRSSSSSSPIRRSFSRLRRSWTASMRCVE